MNVILYRNEPIGHVQNDEVSALSHLASYWGLQFDQNHFQLKPALSSHTICLKNVNTQQRQSVEELLSHTGIYVTDNDENCDFLLEIFSQSNDQLAPITLLANDKTYYLKYSSNVTLNLQKSIHKNVWLPFRYPYVSLTFNNLHADEQQEVIAYLVIQFFLRTKMNPISHLPLTLYSKLVEDIITPINPSFAKMQYKQMWPQLPPELVEQTNENPYEHPHKEQQSELFNPFKPHSQSPHKKINPFHANKKNESSPFNPFK